MRKPMHLHLKKGALHKALHVAPGHKIAHSALTKAAHSGSALMRKRAQFALNASHWKHATSHFKSTHRAIPHHSHAVHPGHHVHR